MLINEDFFDDIEGKDIEVDSTETETHSKPENYWSITLEFFDNCNPSDFIKQRGKYKEYMSSLIPAIEKYFKVMMSEIDTECEFIWAFIYQNRLVNAGDSYNKRLYDRDFCIWWDSADNSGRLQLTVNFKKFELDGHLKNILFLFQMIYGVFFKFDNWITVSDPVISLYCKYTYPDMYWREMVSVGKAQFIKRELPKPIVHPIKNPKMWIGNYNNTLRLNQDFKYEDMLKLVAKDNDAYRLVDVFRNDFLAHDICRVGVLPFDKEDDGRVIKLMPHNAFSKFTLFNATTANYTPINTLSWVSIYNNDSEYSHLVNEHILTHGGIVMRKFKYGQPANVLMVVFDGTIKGEYDKEYILTAETNMVLPGDKFDTEKLNKIYAKRTPDAVGQPSAALMLITDFDTEKAREIFDYHLKK